jgi:hypothetical protein
VLQGKRAEYGEEVLRTLADQLVKDYGGSFAEKHLRRMVQFAATFPDEKIVVSLIRQLREMVHYGARNWGSRRESGPNLHIPSIVDGDSSLSWTAPGIRGRTSPILLGCPR